MTKPGNPLNSLSDQVLSILDSLPDGVVTVDREWKILSLNKAAETLFGVKEGDALGCFCHRVVRGDACRNECPLAITLETGENVYGYDVQVPRPDGTSATLAVNTAVLRDTEGNPIGGVMSYRDLTMVKRPREDANGRTDSQGLAGATGERERILSALQESRWNREEAASRLHMSRTTLWRRMVKYRLLDRPSRRAS
jgi:PAS domain S-box-containing protein